MSDAKTTTSHATIKKWAEARGGRPSVVRTHGKGGILRFDFGEKEDNLEEISWDEFFKIFDDGELAFLHQDKTHDGKESRFSRFVHKSGEEHK